MKKGDKIMRSIMVAAILLLASSFVVRADSVARLTCSVALPDFWQNWVTSDQKHYSGPLVETLNTVFDGTRHIWKIAMPRPWSRSLVELKRGNHAAALPVVNTEDQGDKYAYIGPIGSVTARFFRNITATKPQSIVLAHSFRSVDNINEMLAVFDNVMWVENSKRAERVFIMGKAGFTLLPDQQIASGSVLHDKPNIFANVMPPLQQPLYMIVSKASDCHDDVGYISQSLMRAGLNVN